jgi:hypothetical protein
MSKFEFSQLSQAVLAFGQTSRFAGKGPYSAGFLAFWKVSAWRN